MMRLPDRCPACTSHLHVAGLGCDSCGTQVQGRFPVCRFCSLSPEDGALLDLFLRSRGNVKEVERELGVSYPTVRGRLDQLWVRLGYKPPAEPESPEDILEALKAGELSVDEAATRLRKRGESEA